MSKVTHGAHATKVITLKSSAAETASTNGSAVGTSLATLPITGDNAGFTRHATVFLDITASGGTTPTLDIVIQGRVNGSGAWTTLPGGSFSRKTGTGTDAIRIDGPLPVELRYSSTITGTTPTFTYSLSAVLGG